MVVGPIWGQSPGTLFCPTRPWLKVLTWPQDSADLIPIEHLWDVLEKQIRSMKAEHTFRSIVESVPRGGSELFWRQRDYLHNIRQLVIMLWLIDLYSQRYVTNHLC